MKYNTATLLNQAGKELTLKCHQGYNYTLDGRFITLDQLMKFVRNGAYKVIADNTYLKWPTPIKKFKLFEGAKHGTYQLKINGI